MTGKIKTLSQTPNPGTLLALKQTVATGNVRHESVFGIWDLGFEVWDLQNGGSIRQESVFGIWDLGFGAWDLQKPRNRIPEPMSRSPIMAAPWPGGRRVDTLFVVHR